MHVTSRAEGPATAGPRRSWTVTRAFARAATSITRIRSWARERLRAADVLPDTVAVAELLLSEIATNAVRHGSGDRIMVRLSLDDELEASVHDQDPFSRPRLRRPGAAAESGRGLVLVQALTTVWGSDIVRSGKWVWFRLPLDVGDLGRA
jgi:anti-sigma regulatory factor (Ser/Thr protein kinase)